MRPFMIVTALILLLGCDGGPDVKPRPPGPPQNVDWATLRAVCYWLDDGEIEDEFADIAADRQLGFSREFEVERATANCEGDPDCVACLTAIIDEVYE